MAQNKRTTPDLRGTRFGKLVVVELVHAPRRRKWKCKCDCGRDALVYPNNLKRGLTRSCGCGERAWRRAFGPSRRTHGASNTRELSIWNNMIRRCEDPKNAAFRYYGARGIRVCKRWRNSFQAFMADMGPRPSRRHSVDRMDNNGNYEPRNCRWALPIEQGRNARHNRLITFAGETMCMSAWAERVGMTPDNLKLRLRRGWTIARALTEPLRSWPSKRSPK